MGSPVTLTGPTYADECSLVHRRNTTWTAPEGGMILKDSVAFRTQFLDCTPDFIDILSFEPADGGQRRHGVLMASTYNSCHAVPVQDR